MMRVFIASYDDIATWGRKTILNSIKETDAIFLLNTGVNLSKPKEGVIEELKRKCKVHIVQTMPNAQIEVAKKYLQAFFEKEDGEWNLYIIGKTVVSLYKDKEEFSKAKEIYTHDNFSVGSLKPQNEVEETMQQDFMNVLNTVADKPKIEKEEKKTKKKEVKEVIASTVEKEIFETEIKSDVYEESFTEIENAKAMLAAKLQDRIQRHILKQLFSKKDVAISEKQLFSFIKLMLKTNDAKSFNKSWKTSNADLELNLSEALYDKFKGEISYYSHIVTYIYEKDEWDD